MENGKDILSNRVSVWGSSVQSRDVPIPPASSDGKRSVEQIVNLLQLRTSSGGEEDRVVSGHLNPHSHQPLQGMVECVDVPGDPKRVHLWSVWLLLCALLCLSSLSMTPYDKKGKDFRLSESVSESMTE